MLANEKTQTAAQDGAARTRPFTSKEYLESLRDGREIWIYACRCWRARWLTSWWR
jgi:hypothetical protein